MVNGRIHAELFEEIIEKVGKFVFIKGARPIGVVLVENVLDVVLEHLILQVI